LSFSVLLASQARLAEAHELIDTFGTNELGVAFIRGTHARSHLFVQEARPLDAIAQAELAVAAFAAAGPWGTPVSRRSVITHISTGRTWAGDPRTGLAEAIEARDTATDDFQLAIAALAQAMAAAMLGQPRTAGAVLEGAASRWRAIAGGGLPVRWLLGMSTWVHAAAGELSLAKQRLAEFDAVPHPAVSLDAYAEVGRARILIREGHLDAGRHHLRDWSARYQAAGRLSSELMCRYELVRLGHADEMAGRMAELAGVAQGGMFTAWIDHAVHAAVGSADGLGEVAERLAAMGYLEFAADAAAHASDAARRAGSQREATRWSVRAADLRSRCETPGSPLVGVVDNGPVPLTRRERDVALLAAQGLASKEIGERLFISFRTAENHLARVYDKLGIRTRAELARALDGGTVGLVA
jgi:DNA-binding CsgD family transcriptional regulator